MPVTYKCIPAPDAAGARARIDAWLAEPDPRARETLWGIRPETAVAPVLDALAAPRMPARLMVRLVTLADNFRVQQAAPALLTHAATPHVDLDGYLARIAACQGAAVVASVPARAPEAGYRTLVGLVAEPAAAQALPELLLAFTAYAPARDMDALERRIPALVADLDAAGRRDDGLRLQARTVEEFGLNDIPRAHLALDIMEGLRRHADEAARLDALVAIHVGADLRFRPLLAPFAVRLLQEAAIAGGGPLIAAAFLRACRQAATLADARTRAVRQAISAQAAAWFGAVLEQPLATLANALPPQDAGIFGTGLRQVYPFGQ